MHRRAVMMAGIGVATNRVAGALPVAAGDLAFRLIRHDIEIGRHTLVFDRQDDSLTVHIAVDALVTFLSIPIVRYTHRTVESWRGKTLVELKCETLKNGQREWAQAKRTSAGLVVAGSRTAQYIAPEPALATDYWNRRVLEGPMVSLEDGLLLSPAVAVGRTEAIRLASGGSILAERYKLTGALDLDLWYDGSGSWASMAFAAPDGSIIRYERL